MGLEMMKSSMDWDEKQKAEAKSMQDALSGYRSMALEGAKTGSLPDEMFSDPNSVKALGPGASILQGINANKKKLADLEYQTKELTKLKEGYAVGETWANAFSKITDTLTKYGESQQKTIGYLDDLSAKGIIPPDQVNAFKSETENTVLTMFEKTGLGKEYGPIIKESIANGKIKEGMQAVYKLEIAKYAAQINDPELSAEEKASAYGKAKKIIAQSGSEAG